MQVAANMNATSDGEQSRQQNDEGDVFGKERMHQTDAGRRAAENHCKRNEKRQGPGRRNFSIMVMPQSGCGQGQNGN